LAARSTVTAAICTYTEDRWSLIVDAVDSLRRQTRPADELLLVVDYNPALAARMRRELPGVRVVENRHTKGLSGAKNTALDEVTTDLLAVLDDDATADEKWLETLLTHFDSPDVVAVGSASIPRWARGSRPRWFPPELDWTVGCSYRGLPETATAVRNVFGGAMAMRCDAARAAGGFDHQLGRGDSRFAGAEETEFCIRLADGTNTRIVYEPAAAIHHLVPETRAAWSYVWRRCYGEGRSKATLARLATSNGANRNGDALRTERRYLTHTIPSGLWRELRRARPDAAAALVGAVAATSVGFVLGKVRGIGAGA
jgi:GT2 family glycosyltransferase